MKGIAAPTHASAPFAPGVAEARGVYPRWDRVVPYMYILPAMMALAVFVYWPLSRTLELSLFDWNLVSAHRKFVGIQNFASLAKNQIFWISVANTAKAATALVAGTVAVPLALALAVLRLRGAARAAYRVVIFSPTVISMAIAAVIWLWIYNPLNGILAHALGALGGRGFVWLTDPQLAIWAVIIVTAWKTFGYNFVIFTAGLLAISAEVVEAARIDGAGEWQVFRRVMWPLLTPTTLFVLLTTCILVPQYLFIPTQILTAGGPNEHSNNLGFVVWQQGFELFRVGFASSIAVVVFFALLGFAILQFRLLERGVHYDE